MWWNECSNPEEQEPFEKNRTEYNKTEWGKNTSFRFRIFIYARKSNLLIGVDENKDHH